MIGDRHHHLDMVLYQDHGDAVIGEHPDELLEIFDLAVGQTRRRFVQQEHSGSQREGACDFKPPLMTERYIAGLLFGKVGKSDEFQQLACLAEEPALLAPEARKPKQGFGERVVIVRMKSGQHVLEHGHLPEQFRILERPRDALPRELIAGQPGNAGAEECDAAFARNIEPGNQVEQAGLAGAVRSDQGVDGTGLDLEADIVDRGQSAEPHGEGFGLERYLLGFVAGTENFRQRHAAVRPALGLAPARLHCEAFP